MPTTVTYTDQHLQQTISLNIGQPRSPPFGSATLSHAGNSTTWTNPKGWPTEYRRIPPFRPTNRELDPNERPNGSNTAEYIFVNVMLNGVRIQSTLVTFYEQTGGKYFPGLTRYKIGGEW